MLIPTIPIGIEYLKSLLSFSPLVLSSFTFEVEEILVQLHRRRHYLHGWGCMDGGVWMGEDGGKKEACTYISIAQLHR